jgi:hypothetical protein
LTLQQNIPLLHFSKINQESTSMFKIRKLFIATSVLSISLSFPVFAFDERIKEISQQPDMVEVSSRFADTISLADYGSCSAGWAGASLVWVRSDDLDENVQLSWQLIGEGLKMYRQKFISQNNTEEPLNTVVKQMGGDYYKANQRAILTNCQKLLDSVFE